MESVLIKENKFQYIKLAADAVIDKAQFFFFFPLLGDDDEIPNHKGEAVKYYKMAADQDDDDDEMFLSLLHQSISHKVIYHFIQFFQTRGIIHHIQ